MAGNPDTRTPSDEGRAGWFSGKNLISIKDFSKAHIEDMLDKSEAMLHSLERHERRLELQSKIMATLFFEPSTRTRLSFESAMQRLGGGAIGFADASTSSSAKGETLADTVKIVSSYADIIVIRHPKAGAMAEAVENASVPVINAGDGIGEHPTQALIDLFTIRMEKKRLGGLDIALVGDLKNGRTIHSLAYALAMFGNNLTLIAPDALQMPEGMVEDIKSRYHVEVSRSDSLDEAGRCEVVYIPRVQKERFTDIDEYHRFAKYYVVNRDFLEKADGDPIIMSPLPRTEEISRDIDNMKNSVYFKQASYGVPVRMAILSMILEGIK